MKLNKSEAKIMMVGTNKNTNSLNFKIERIKIKDVKEFKYLHNEITQDERNMKIGARLHRLKKYLNK